MRIPSFLINILKVFSIKVARLYYCEIDLSKPISVINCNSLLTVKKITTVEIESIIELLLKEKNDYVLYVEKSSNCYSVKVDNNLAGFVWINNHNIYFDSDIISQLNNNGTFAYQGYLFEKYRGKYIFEKCMEFLYNLKKQEGYKYASVLVDYHNEIGLFVQNKFTKICKLIWLMTLPFNKKIILGAKLGQGKYIKKNMKNKT